MAAIPRKPSLTDLTDDPWNLLQPLLPPAKPGGRPRAVDMREVITTLLSLHRTGCQWDMLPHDLLPKRTVYESLSPWRRDGPWQPIMDALRAEVREQQAPSKEPTPRAASLDSPSVKTTAQGGERGDDGGKKIMGRNRHISVDVWGLLLVVCVRSAATASPGQWRWEIVRRPEGSKGVVLLPKRWGVERTFAWLGRCRRHSKDDERRTASSASRLRISAMHLMLKRLKPSNVSPPFHYRIVA